MSRLPNFVGKAGVILAHNLALPRGGSLREAYGLARHLTRPHQAARYAESIGAFPCAEASLAASLSAAGELGGVFRAAFSSDRTLPALVALGTLERIFDRSMETVIRSILQLCRKN